jgi:hypothetical protein
LLAPSVCHPPPPHLPLRQSPPLGLGPLP